VSIVHARSTDYIHLAVKKNVFTRVMMHSGDDDCVDDKLCRALFSKMLRPRLANKTALGSIRSD
jgi:hypothetical protein